MRRVDRQMVVRLWLARQGLATPRGRRGITRSRLSDHLTATGALQLDPINAVDRAHYLTLWSRFGAYDREQVDDWVYRDRCGYEYWGHEASIVPAGHLRFARRRMIGFPPKDWANRAWWKQYATSPASKRRVLRRLKEEGPLESADFERRPTDGDAGPRPGFAMPMPKEDKRSLQLLWHSGRVAITARRSFRRVYDVAERVYPDVDPVTTTALEDEWLRTGLSGNGIAPERHLVGYITGPSPGASDRRRIVRRNLRMGRIVEVDVPGLRGPCYALPEHLDVLGRLPEPQGTTLICPFDSVLWQRQRAEDLLGFRYRIEIYVPPDKREFGYYTLPILHDGALVGRLDPKLHRDRQELEIRALRLEGGVKRSAPLKAGLADALVSLAEFSSATRITLPTGWRGLI